MPPDDPWPDDQPVSVHYLLAAERGTLRYDRTRYPIHAVPNNVLAMIWGGLLVDGRHGPVLTDAGRERAANRASETNGSQDDELPTTSDAKSKAPKSNSGTQLDLFAPA